MNVYCIIIMCITYLYVFTAYAMETTSINPKQNLENNHEVLWKMYTKNNSNIPLHFVYADNSLAFSSFSYENTLEGKRVVNGQKDRWHFLSKHDCPTNQIRKFAITLTEEEIETKFSWTNRDENNKKYGRKNIKRCKIATIKEKKDISGDIFCGENTGKLIVSIWKNGEQDLPKPHICVSLEFIQEKIPVHYHY